MRAPGVVVMGVSGSGKTTVAALLAAALGATFRDGDDFHPASNVAKMTAGQPLDDADRAPWLDAIAAAIDAAGARGDRLVVACSALRRAYRDRLRAGAPGVRFAYLEGSRDLVAARLAARGGHFMPASLLDSQFATLEPPGADEGAVTASITRPPEEIAAEIAAALKTKG